MEERRFKERIYELVARIAKAADSPRRLEILEVLAQSPRTVESLARETALSVANASRHLQVLRQAGLVEARKHGLFVEYRLAETEVFELLRVLRMIAERRLGDVERLVRGYLGARDDLEPVGRAELLKRVRSGSVVVLDVRPREEYRAGHIAGAVSIPVDELPRRLRDLPSRKEIVAYCRGPYCLMAFERGEDPAQTRSVGPPTRGRVPRMAGRPAAGPPGRGSEHTMKLLFILNDPPYGTERTYNGLRLARTAVHKPEVEVRVFLIGDAVAVAKNGQKVPSGYYNLGTMLDGVMRHGGAVGICGSCIDARGIGEGELVAGARRSSMDELTAWTLDADKVLVF